MNKYHMYALLPMKEHSERIPGKNYKLLNMKPLFFYIADILSSTNLFLKLVIDTDSRLIGEMAKERYGDWVIILQRPEALCGDYVPMNAILAHDIQVVGYGNDFMQTHSTNPFLRAETIRDAAKIYQTGKIKGKLDSLFAVNTLRTRLYDKDLTPINHNPAILGRTQDLNVVYEENSNFYFFSGESFIRNRHRIGINPRVYPMPRSSIESMDIDELSDWELSETLFKVGLWN